MPPTSRPESGTALMELRLTCDGESAGCRSGWMTSTQPFIRRIGSSFPRTAAISSRQNAGGRVDRRR
jgi:hypothetical protein